MFKNYILYSLYMFHLLYSILLHVAMNYIVARLPSKPGRPVAERNGGIYITVKWTQPEDDGGADITGYVIKYGKKDTQVDDVAALHVTGNTTVFQFTHQLEERTRYQFAVATENTAGQGEFSELSNYIFTGDGKQCWC